MVMGIQYYCRHCGDKLGEVGFEHYGRIQATLVELTEEERLFFLYKDNKVVNVITICESCQNTLEENPHYYQYDTFLQ